MATGIISAGAFLLGPDWLSRALLVVASAGLALLGAALMIRLAVFRASVAADVRAPERVFGFFTIVAGIDLPASLPVSRARAGFVGGASFALWAFGTWWIPLLIAAGLWRHVRRRWPLSYEPALWSMVFPLGMYSVATLSLGRAERLGSLEPVGRFMLWVAVAAWALVTAAFVARLRRWPARARPASPRPGHPPPRDRPRQRTRADPASPRDGRDE